MSDMNELLRIAAGRQQPEVESHEDEGDGQTENENEAVNAALREAAFGTRG